MTDIKLLRSKLALVEDMVINDSEEIYNIIDNFDNAAIICQSKRNNPNYLSIVHSNSTFNNIFNLIRLSIVGKNYDFLLSEFGGVEYDFGGGAQYIKLIKSVKDSLECTVSLVIMNGYGEQSGNLFQITFLPFKSKNGIGYAIFIFEKLNSDKSEEDAADKIVIKSVILNLERSLRNERFSREVASLIISDIPLGNLFSAVAEMMCRHFRVDRCIIHDFNRYKTSFLSEYADNGFISMLPNNISKQDLDEVSDYLKFCYRFCSRNSSSSIGNSIFLINDVQSNVDFDQISKICGRYSISSQLMVTTTFRNLINGIIHIHQSDDRVWTEEELELIKTISEQLSIAIDRSASIEKVMIANHALMKKSLQIKKAFEQEKETRKMQGEFISLASHEFKTPLQIIDSTRELLVRKIKSSGLVDDSIDRGMERIKSAVQRMNGLIDSTLSLAKMEDAGNKIKVEKSEFDLAKLINDLVDSNHSLAAQKGVVVKIDILNLPQNFYGDQKLLDHSFANIISNAIKYSKNNTVVTIKSKVDNGFAYIVVTDQGIGIPQEDLSNIGKKFFRAKNTISVAGTGIGLYITKHFIELHQGSFKIKSVQNVGTSIAVALPL